MHEYKHSFDLSTATMHKVDMGMAKPALICLSYEFQRI